MKRYPESISSESDFRRLVAAMLDRVGTGFHPDTPPGEYVNTATGAPVFDPLEVGQLEALWEQAFVLLTRERIDEIAYEHFMRRFQRAFGKE